MYCEYQLDVLFPLTKFHDFVCLQNYVLHLKTHLYTIQNSNLILVNRWTYGILLCSERKVFSHGILHNMVTALADSLAHDLNVFH